MALTLRGQVESMLARQQTITAEARAVADSLADNTPEDAAMQGVVTQLAQAEAALLKVAVRLELAEVNTALAERQAAKAALQAKLNALP